VDGDSCVNRRPESVSTLLELDDLVSLLDRAIDSLQSLESSPGRQTALLARRPIHSQQRREVGEVDAAAAVKIGGRVV